jgi:hypothetical protein
MTLTDAINLCRQQKISQIENFSVWLMSDVLCKSLLPLFVPSAIDFVEGDNCYADPHYVPENEIWINDEVSQPYWRYIFAHELKESLLMRDQHLAYEEAHKQADELEWKMRITDVLKALK